MIVKVANKSLKQPIEIYIPDEEWEEISSIENKDELNARLNSIAMKQVSKYGYQIGFCGIHKREVTLRECMQCGITKGWGSGAENMAKWEGCKKENINYTRSPAKILTNKVKSVELRDKMAPETTAQQRRDKQTLSESIIPERGNDTFKEQSDQIMNSIREKENNS